MSIALALSIQIEAKIGLLIDTSTDGRIQLPVFNETSEHRLGMIAQQERYLTCDLAVLLLAVINIPGVRFESKMSEVGGLLAWMRPWAPSLNPHSGRPIEAARSIQQAPECTRNADQCARPHRRQNHLQAQQRGRLLLQRRQSEGPRHAR